uniref:Uncharacterized protein n=1 Tax=Ditylenchus dipsaci TaxID=166011 RepID=A0A915DC88_9BILA
MNGVIYWKQDVLQYLLRSPDDRCVTVVSKRTAVTYRHREHLTLKVGDAFVVSPHLDSPYCFPDKQSSIEMKVVGIDEHLDSVLLQSEVDLCNGKPYIRISQCGETYVQLGLSVTDRQSSLAITHGVITSAIEDDNFRIMASGGMRAGDSGGGIYSVNGSFLGMAVECDAETHDLSDTLKETLDKMDNRWTSRCHFIPSGYIRKAFRDIGINVID